MKLPEKIKGRNRIRDFAIVLAFKKDNLDFPQIADRFNLSERHIVRILSKNHAIVKRDKEWEKEKRINRLGRILKQAKPTSKDEIDIMAEMRKEIEGDTKIITNGDTKIVIIYPQNQKELDEDRAKRISSVLST